MLFIKYKKPMLLRETIQSRDIYYVSCVHFFVVFIFLTPGGSSADLEFSFLCSHREVYIISSTVP